MPSARQGYEKLKYMVEHGQGEEKIHIVFVERDQAERIKNEKRQTRFVLECDDWQTCSAFQMNKHRIISRVKNKSVGLSLMEKAWREALSNAELDKIMAVMDAIEAGVSAAEG